MYPIKCSDTNDLLRKNENFKEADAEAKPFTIT